MNPPTDSSLNVFDALYRSLNKLGNRVGLNLPYLIKNGNWVTLRFFVLSVTGFLLSYCFAKYGSKELLGQYQLILAIMAIVSASSFLGLNAAALEAVVQGREAGVLRASRQIFLSSLIGTLALVGIGVYYSFFRQEGILGQTLFLVAALFPFFYASSTWNVYYEGKLFFKQSSLKTIVLNLSLTLFLVLGILLKFNVIALIAIYLLVTILFQGSYLLGVARKIKDTRHDFIDTKFGVSVSIQKFVSGLSSNLPPLMIAFLFGTRLLGVYFIAYYVVSALSSFLSNLLSLYLPILFGEQKLDHKKILILNGIAGVMVWTVFIIFLNFFFILIYGEDYRSSLELAYRVSFLLLLTPLHTYLVGYFSTRKKNGLLIGIFCFTNSIGLLALWLSKGTGFSVSVPIYLYVLEIGTVLPLLWFYVFNRVKKDSLNLARK